MKNFLKRLLLFSVLVFATVELFIRFTHLTIDVPQREISTEGIQKYIPNQSGYWSNASHKWVINKYGWAVEAPNSMKNLITLIGDSHIENFMNSSNCQPSYFLKQMNPTYNFLQMGRSGASLIEYLEFSKYAQKEYSPVKQLIFIKENDFPESIRNVSIKKDVTQIDIKTKKLFQGKMQSPGLKKIIYNIKTIYYFKDKIKFKTLKNDKTEKKYKSESGKKNLEYYDILLKFIKENYDLNNIIFAVHPNTDSEIINLLKENSIKFYIFSENQSWNHSQADNSHWSCYGHREASLQLTKFLRLSKSN
jgi:hypothetical protein